MRASLPRTLPFALSLSMLAAGCGDSGHARQLLARKLCLLTAQAELPAPAGRANYAAV